MPTRLVNNEKGNGLDVDVCLVSPASRANAPYPPLGLMYVASYLEKQGIKVRIVDLKVDHYGDLKEFQRKRVEDEIVNEVEAIQPRLVGITCLVTEVSEVINLGGRIKKRLKETKIMIGGIHPTMYPEDLLFSGSPVDYVIMGEGEQTATELAQAVIKSDHQADISGIARFDGAEVYKTMPRPVIKNLDEIPFPLYQKVNMNYYLRPNIYAIRNMFLSTVFIFTSRGCPYLCSFCVNKNIHKIMGSHIPVRSRSVKNVVDEIEYLANEYGIDAFYIYDDTFCIREEYTLDFCRELRRRRLNLIWAAETRVNLISEEAIKAMKSSGCIQLDFGVESGSPNILRRLRKGITVDQVRKTFALCHKLGMRAMANFMFNTPGETEEDIQKTLALAREIDASYYNFSLMTPFPGTDIYEQVEPKLRTDEYSLLGGSIRKIADPRFKFAKHDLDLNKILHNANRSFNSLTKRAAFIFIPRYLWQIFNSRKKLDYVKGLWQLCKRVVEYFLEKDAQQLR